MTDSIISIQDKKIIQYLKTQNIIDANSIFDYLLNLSGKVYRKVKSRKTEEITINENNYFIKKHYQITLREFFKNVICLRNPFVNATHEHQAIIALKNLGINTLEVAALGTKYNSRLYWTIGPTSFLVTKAIDPNIELDKFCELYICNRDYYKIKRIFIKHIASITRKIHLNGLNHRDYYLCHFLISLSPEEIKDLESNLEKIDNFELTREIIINNIYLIDLHRMQIRKSVPKRYIIKDISSLLFSVRNLKLSKTDKLRFIKEYFNILNNQKIVSFVRRHRRFLDAILYKAESLKEKG